MKPRSARVAGEGILANYRNAIDSRVEVELAEEEQDIDERWLTQQSG